MVARFFDRLDDALSGLVPLLYLLGLAVGTVAYFAGIVVDLGVAVGVCLAIAAECHSYLVQRRMRMARARLSRVQVADSAYGYLEEEYNRQRRVLLLLIAFSTYNSVQFVASTWHPTGWLPGFVQIAIRGAIVPGLFYLAGELTPLITEPGDVLAHASREMTFAAVRTMSQQWRRRLRRARKRNLDLAPIAITLLQDAGDMPGAARIRVIAEGLTAVEEGRLPVSATTTPTSIAEEPNGRPPTGGGSPTTSPVRTPRVEPPAVLRLQAPLRPRRAAAQGRAGGTHRSGVRTGANTLTESVEEKARLAWVPGMTVSQLQRKAGISRSAAGKYRKVLAAEAAELARQKVGETAPVRLAQ